jgi:hypothetical protein
MAKKPQIKSQDKPQDNEVIVGHNKIGPDTVIQVNLKTLIIVLGILLSGLTTAWLNLSGTIKSANEARTEDVKDLKSEIKKIKDEDLKTISVQLNQVDGKVQGIFMNMQRENNSNTQPINQPIRATIVQSPNIPTNNGH